MTDPDSLQPQESTGISLKSLREYEDLGKALAQQDASPVVTAVNKILHKALIDKANEIQLDPQPDSLKVNFCKNGIWVLAYPALPSKVIPAITSRIKTLASLNNANRRIPQTGRIQRSLKGEHFDFLVKTLPTTHGERITLKIVYHSALASLDGLISQAPVLQSIQAILGETKGLILITGPGHSGKSTTLFSILQEKARSGARVTTLENPIEYTLPEITQIQVNPNTSIGFPDALQGVLTEPVDVIAFSEIPDRETAIACLNAAQNHLVLATIPADDLGKSLAYLRELDIPDSTVSQSLIGIIHQRLVRQVCEACRQPYVITDEERQRYGFLIDRFADQGCYQATVVESPDHKSDQTEKRTCSVCGGAGYVGQIALCEVLSVTPMIKTLIEQGRSSQDVYTTAVLQAGMTTLLTYGLELVAQGRTTVEEIDRIAFSPDTIQLEHQRTELAKAGTSVELLADELSDTLVEVDLMLPSQPTDVSFDDMPVSLDSVLDSMLDPIVEVSDSANAKEPEPANLDPAEVATADDFDVDPAMDLDSFHLSEEAEDEVKLEIQQQQISQGTDSDDFFPTVNLDDFELPEEFDTAIIARSVQSTEKKSAAKVQLDEDSLEELEAARQQLREIATVRSQLQQKVESQTKELNALQQKVVQLQQQNESLTKNLKEERAGLKEQLVRERKELNRQFDRQKADVFRKAKKDVVLTMLEAVDSFEQANSRLSEEERSSQLHKGYQAIYRLLLANLTKVGVVAVESVGKPFDPNVHEAVMMEESHQYSCDTVVEEFRRGYVLDEIILRPAQVKVAVAQEGPPPASQPVIQLVAPPIQAEEIEPVPEVEIPPAETTLEAEASENKGSTNKVEDLSSTGLEGSDEDWLSSALAESATSTPTSSSSDRGSEKPLTSETSDLELVLPSLEVADGNRDLDQMLVDLGFDDPK